LGSSPKQDEKREFIPYLGMQLAQQTLSEPAATGGTP